MIQEMRVLRLPGLLAAARISCYDCKIPATTLGVPLILRRIAALIAGGALLVSLLFFSYRRNKDDRASFFAFYPVDLMGPGYRKQIAMFKQIVPKGSTVVYLMDKYEPWQSELWQRSLYPDYEMQQISGLKALQAPAERQFRDRKRAEYIISAGKPPLDPGFTWKLSLPEYLFCIPVTVGKLPLP